MQQSIADRIAARRRARHLTQSELAQRLGVTDKAVSKWETGRGLPDVSLYPALCSLLGLRLEDFFADAPAAQALPPADEAEANAADGGAFTREEQIAFFKEKWQREHLAGCVAAMLAVVALIIFGFVRDNGVQYAGMACGLLFGLIERNRMAAYVEKSVYIRNRRV